MIILRHNKINKLRTIKYTQVGEVNELHNLNNNTMKAILFIKQLKKVDGGFISIKFKDLAKELELNFADKYSVDWNWKQFFKNELHKFIYFVDGKCKQLFKFIKYNEGVITFYYDVENINKVILPEEGEESKFFFTSYMDLINITSTIKKEVKKDAWSKLFIKLASSVYNSRKTKSEVYNYAKTKLEWNFSHQELQELGFTTTNISRGELNHFVKAVNDSKVAFKLEDLLKKSRKKILSENNTSKKGKFSKYLKDERVKTIYQFVPNSRRVEYIKKSNITDLKRFNEKAFSILDKYGIEYHFSKTRRIEGKNGGNGKAGVKGWNIVPSYGFDTWNNNETLPSQFNEYVYPIVVFSKKYIVIDIDNLNENQKDYYIDKFDTIYEKSKNGIHLLFNNDINFKKANTNNQGTKYRSKKVDWIGSQLVYDLRGMGKAATTTKLDGWNLSKSKELKNISTYFDAIDLMNNKDMREHKQLIELEEKQKQEKEKEEFWNELFDEEN